MTQNAIISDKVTYRPGEGAPQVIPPGPAEVDVVPDSAILSWIEDNGATGLTAMPINQFKEYVKKHKITLEK